MQTQMFTYEILQAGLLLVHFNYNLGYFFIVTTSITILTQTHIYLLYKVLPKQFIVIHLY